MNYPVNANYDYFEMFIVAYILKYPHELKNVHSSYIYNPGFYNILDMIFNLNSIFSVSKNTLLALVDSNWSKYDLSGPTIIDKIYNLVNELDAKSDKDNASEFNNVLNYLKNRQSQDNAIVELEAAIDLIKKGKIQEGISKAKSIKFSVPSELLSTKTLMLQSLVETNGFKTGIDIIDNKMNGLLKGNIMTIIGDTGGMKTMSSVWLCLKILIENPNFRCLYFEKEMPVKDIARRLLAYTLQIDIGTIFKASIDYDPEAMNTINKLLLEKFKDDKKLNSVLDRLLIVPQNEFHDTIDMHRYISHYNPDIWCLDFLTQIASSSDSKSKDEGYALQVKNSVDKIKSIVSDTDSFGIILSQLNKGTARKRANKIPTLDDIEWSGTISQYSAYIFGTFHPDKYYKGNVDKRYFYLCGLKTRNSEDFVIPLAIYPQYSTLEDEPEGNLKQEIIEWYKGYITKGGI